MKEQNAAHNSVHYSAMVPRLILGSSSPRRRELLGAAGFSFEVLAASIDESRRENEAAGDYAARMAEEKATAAAGKCDSKSPVLVLGADTVVAVGGEVLGKPDTVEVAAGMLRLLSGREHRVLTGVCLVCAMDGKILWKQVRVATTMVRFRPLEEAEIASYVASGEPMDKAGAYAIQGLASRFVERIEGCYFNVVGLPVPVVDRMMAEFETSFRVE